MFGPRASVVENERGDDGGCRLGPCPTRYSCAVVCSSRREVSLENVPDPFSSLQERHRESKGDDCIERPKGLLTGTPLVLRYVRARGLGAGTFSERSLRTIRRAMSWFRRL
jgi:hypothetical protein